MKQRNSLLMVVKLILGIAALIVGAVFFTWQMVVPQFGFGMGGVVGICIMAGIDTVYDWLEYKEDQRQNDNKK